ncbi:uncharacterized protein LOC103719078 [Phoenix dactylifera]|uniref:Serine/threonine-protein phosphatase 2A activator n=1 Tax=Phoenix dactylifera TaxID=42345 RepID=A0A8B9A3D6_PHODC|nr:uncharacterized protein LOC103719078 [Phoenix dactylifera]
MTDAEPSSATSADSSCAAVCSTSATAAEASPPLSSVCSACGGPTASISSPPPWTDAYNLLACRPIRTPAINAPTQTNTHHPRPRPPAPPRPPVTPPYHFETPTKRISSPDDIRRFHSSAAGRHFPGFVAALSHSVRGRKISDPVPPLPQTVTSLLSLLQALTSWIDDYHFLPFIFGSAHLIDHKYMKPKSIHNQDILDNFSHEYMYLACVAFVKKVKKGVFAEHSPMLDDISAVPTWSKVNSGMLKIYKAEVLEKVPIMQHFVFGSLIKWQAKR